MGAPASRRGFLSGLATLPLIGGSVALIGSPSAVAEPTSRALLESYDTFLVYERCRLKAEMYGPGSYWDGLPGAEDALVMALGFIPANNAGMRWHGSASHEGSPPSSRAALVLSAAGIDWREGGR